MRHARWPSSCRAPAARQLGASADPTILRQLAVIIQWLQRIDGTLRDQQHYRGHQGESSQRLSPGLAAQDRDVLRARRSFKDEVARLACDWKFTPRVERLRLALLLEAPSVVRLEPSLRQRGAVLDSDLEN